ncbi:MAG: hypothetical protein JWO44_653 [Bacteroidetes bacterium]|nr:hypothetical protein [Bacteroidota bacterium]
MSILILISCNTERRYANYKEGVATIVDFGHPTVSTPVVDAIFGTSSTTTSLEWSNYAFTVKRKVNEYNPDDTTCYDFKIYGEELAYSKKDVEIGEKFVVKYDPKIYDNDHSYLVLYQPVFLENEKTIATKGKIIKLHGIDRMRDRTIGIRFQYTISSLNQTGDTTLTYTKYQYLPAKLNIDSIKADIKTNKEFNVLYSVENPKRAILYYSQ